MLSMIVPMNTPHCVQSMLGLDDFRCIFQRKWLCDCVGQVYNIDRVANITDSFYKINCIPPTEIISFFQRARLITEGACFQHCPNSQGLKAVMQCKWIIFNLKKIPNHKIKKQINNKKKSLSLFSVISDGEVSFLSYLYSLLLAKQHLSHTFTS